MSMAARIIKTSATQQTKEKTPRQRKPRAKNPPASKETKEQAKKVLKDAVMDTPADVEKTVEAKFRRIADMKPEDREQLHHMYLNEKPMPYIAETLQGVMGLFKDVKKDTLLKYLYRYKWEVIDKGFVATPVETLRSAAKMVADIKADVDILGVMRDLVITQQGRVAKLLVREKDMPMLFNSLGGEMKTLAGFVQQFADLSFDIGTLKRVPRLTKVEQDGISSLIESDGKEAVAVSVNRSKLLDKAAKEFFNIMNSEVQVESEG